MSNERQELNVRVIGVSFAAAMASDPAQAARHIRSAREYLSDARSQAASATVTDAIVRLEAEIDRQESSPRTRQALPDNSS